MKKLILLLALAAFILSGCSSGSNAEQEERFVLETEQQQEYKNIIDETLKSYYWYYDESSFAYFESTVPQENDSTKAMFDAVRENGMELSSSSGKKAVLYTVDLIHFNGNKRERHISILSGTIWRVCIILPKETRQVHMVLIRGMFLQKERNF